MTLKGVLTKMKTEYNSPIGYYLELEKDFIYLNNLIGKQIELNFLYYKCLNCNLEEEIYRSGYCKKCFFILPQTNLSILKPHLSKAHLGIRQRDLEWEKNFELSPHVVYLADTGEPKVGVTREKQIFTRWIDQGALRALKIAHTPNRYLAGMIEISLSRFISDRTSYKKMLNQKKSTKDLIKIKHQLKVKIPLELTKYFTYEDYIYDFTYPIEKYPLKIQSLNLSSLKSLEKKLSGIKGQYLLFEDESVLNIRNHEGFYISLKI